MKTIDKIDTNFTVQTHINRKGIRFYPADDTRFRLSGVFWSEGKFRRMPSDVARQVSDGVDQLHTQTAGGRLRFCTTSSYVAISAQMGYIGKMPHFALTGSAGFDVYERIGTEQVYIGTFVPPFDIQDGYESVVELENTNRHELTIHFPLYSDVDALYIGLDEAAQVMPAPEYTYPQPVVYYGSSITQGACASRPGNAYPNLLSLMLDCEHINLGFSGAAKGEDTMANYIRRLDMSVLVYDYDYNAPTPEYLKATHEKMFRRIREAHPQLPIILLSRPKMHLCSLEEEQYRRDIVQATYEHAVAEGDTHVYFVAGPDLLGEAASAATVDNCHPNDLGFYAMASKLAPLLASVLSTPDSKKTHPAHLL